MAAHEMSIDDWRGAKRCLVMARLVYFCTPTGCQGADTDQRALAMLIRHAPNAEVFTTRGAFANCQRWSEDEWSEHCGSIDHFAFAASDDGTIARYVYEELSDARHMGIPVWFLTLWGDLIPAASIQMQIDPDFDCRRYAHVWISGCR
jgi:hypothetical protein